jgi:hypothetical protein
MVKTPSSVVPCLRRSVSRRQVASLRGSRVKRLRISGVYPFTKTDLMGEWLTRSAVCTSSPLRSLRPCLWQRRISVRLGGVGEKRGTF